MPLRSRGRALDAIASLLQSGARSAAKAARLGSTDQVDFGAGAAGGLLEEGFIRRLDRLNLLTRGRVSAGIVGEHRSRRHASSAEFADFRRYVPGDDFRQIDWNAYARLDGVFLRLTEAKVEIPIHLLLDSSESMNWGHPNKLGFARRLAAAIGYLALAQFDAVSAVGFSDRLYERLPAVRGKNQAPRLLAHLDATPIGHQSFIARSLSQYCEVVPRGGVAFLISDLLSEDDWQSGVMQLLKHGTDVVVIHVVAPQELHPLVDGEIELIDAESGEVVELVIGDEARLAYENRATDWADAVEAFCQRSQIGHMLLDTTVELEEIFLNRMRRRRMVR